MRASQISYGDPSVRWNGVLLFFHMVAQVRDTLSNLYAHADSSSTVTAAV